MQGGGSIAAINVTGNERIETGTIESYMVIQQGDPFDPNKINLSLKTLYATGLFQNVSITRQGNTLNVAVVENPTVNQVYFVGNKAIEDKDAHGGDFIEAASCFHPRGSRGRPPGASSIFTLPRAGTMRRLRPISSSLPDNRVNVVFPVATMARKH